jgi:hypothetical protein
VDAPDGGHPLLFLSHAGIDTEAALDLARRLEQMPAARRAGLRVWIDRRDLVPGRGWQRQLEAAIEHASTAFAVYLRGRGAINWVEAEVRLALSRAATDAGYPFVPILVGEARPADLPAFARQYHAVRTPTAADPELTRALLEAVLRPTGRGPPVAVVEHPFVGLASFGQDTAELFHGRGKEIDELVGRLRRTNLVMVVGDSGSGKSSLARAGLVPRFRGGAFADQSGDQPDPTFWQVVEMRPQARPFERLVDAVNGAARRAGVGARDRGALADWVRTRDPAKIRDAIRDSAPAPSKALLLVDQFEELWTLAAEVERRSFVGALLGVAEGAGEACRVVLTMRRDYYNLCAQFPDLFRRFEAPDRPSKYQLRRMKDEALRAAIVGPLRLTEYRDDPAVDAFADAVLGDVGDRPGDLALLEMALAEAWRHRREHGGDLLRAYVARGRVAGALANAAEDVFHERLAGAPLDLVKGVFVRLVRLGETGGTTRRVARRAEFTDETWPLVQRLAGSEDEEASGRYARLVAIAGEPGQETVEIVHEALATQWPRYQAWLEEAAPDKRVFDRLVEEVAEWAASDKDPRHLAQGADLDTFAGLAERRPTWLSADEHKFVLASREAVDRQRRHERRLFWGVVAALVVAIVAAGIAWKQRNNAVTERAKANAAAELAQAEAQRAEKQADFAKQQTVLAEQREREASAERDKANAAAERVQTATGRLLGTEAQRRLAQPVTQDTSPLIAALATTSWRLVKASDAWNAMQRVPLVAILARVAHGRAVWAVAFSPDGKLLATAGEDGTARVWSTALDDMLHRLCADHGRNLSPREWRRYLGELPWQPTCENWPTPTD